MAEAGGVLTDALTHNHAVRQARSMTTMIRAHSITRALNPLSLKRLTRGFMDLLRPSASQVRSYPDPVNVLSDQREGPVPSRFIPRSQQPRRCGSTRQMPYCLHSEAATTVHDSFTSY